MAIPGANQSVYTTAPISFSDSENIYYCSYYYCHSQGSAQSREVGITIIDREDLEYYPLPFEDKMHLNSVRPILDIKIYNLLGEVIYEDQPLEKAADIELAHQGLYILEVTTEKGTVVHRIVKVGE